MLEQFFNSMDDYCVLYEIRDKSLFPILTNKREIIDFKPVENLNNWFQFQNDYYELIKNKINLNKKEHILYQYHKNNEVFKKLKNSTTDSLTELPTRAAINQYLNQLNRDVPNCIFGIMDIDFFKSINDTNGHLYGDQILSELGAMLRMNEKCFDCLGRYGGEEFFFAIEGQNIDEVLPFLKEMKNIIEQYFATDEKSITISMGISEYYKGESVFDKVAEADKALYYVKEHNRNNIAYKNKDNEYILVNKLSLDEESNHTL